MNELLKKLDKLIELSKSNSTSEIKKQKEDILSLVDFLIKHHKPDIYDSAMNHLKTRPGIHEL